MWSFRRARVIAEVAMDAASIPHTPDGPGGAAKTLTLSRADSYHEH